MVVGTITGPGNPFWTASRRLEGRAWAALALTHTDTHGCRFYRPTLHNGLRKLSTAQDFQLLNEAIARLSGFPS